MATATVTLVDVGDEDVEVKVDYDPPLDSFTPETPLTIAQYLALQAVMYISKQLQEEGDEDGFSDKG